MTNIEAYREFCKEEKDIPLYSKDWWLDVVCDDGYWDVALVKINGKIMASMPYFIKKKMIFKVITLPKLTQTMGPYIKYIPNQNSCKKLAYEKEILNQLIEQLPKVDMFNQSFHHSFTNWLPFYWEGYSQSTGYTYIIEDLNNIEDVYKNFSSSTRKDIRKADKHNIKIVSSENIEAFYEIIMMTHKRKNLKPRESLDFIKKLYKKAKEMDSVILKFAIKDDIIYSASLFFYDNKTLYAIIGGSNSEVKLLGSNQLLDWEMMKFASIKNLSFDFEGSMIEGVEYRNRSYGAVQKQYFNISKIDSKILKFIL